MRKKGRFLIKFFAILFYLLGIFNQKFEVVPNIFAKEQKNALKANIMDEGHKQILDLFGINHNKFLLYESIRRSRRNGSDKPSAVSLNIWILNLLTKNFSQKTFDGGYLSPIMSPDSAEIWYVHKGTIWKMNFDGTSNKQIFSQNKEARLLLDWSNNNKDQLLFLTENNEIFNLEIQSGNLHKVLSTSDPTKDADFIAKLIEHTRRSKKKDLVFDDVYQNKWDILIKLKDDNFNKKLTDDEHVDRDPSWTTDEKSVLFVSDR